MQKPNHTSTCQLAQKDVVLFAIISGAILVGCTVAAAAARGAVMYIVLALIASILVIGGELFCRLWDIRRNADTKEGGKGRLNDGVRGASQ